MKLHRYEDTSGSMTDSRRVVTLRDCRSIIKDLAMRSWH
nr:MAG TPA: hypothetical protein [Caudoviricetes sp.]